MTGSDHGSYLGNIDFEATYQDGSVLQAGGFRFEGVPWDIGEAQPLVVELHREGSLRGHILDIGCGPGDNAVFLAAHGYRVTGVDVSPTVVEEACRRATERNVQVEFRTADATQLDGVAPGFNTVLDSALYHTLPEGQRASYSAALHRVSAPGARLQLCCFTDEIPDTQPLPGLLVSAANLHANLETYWVIDSIQPVQQTTALTPVEMASRLAAFGEDSGQIDLDPTSLATDEQGRVTFPAWHLSAHRRD